jgi:DNA polymerase sigma
MQITHDDEEREFSRKELDRQDLVDNSIMELIKNVNPTAEEIKYDDHFVSKIRLALEDVFTNDLRLCTESEFYP